MRVNTMQQQAEASPQGPELNGEPDDKQLARPRYGHLLGPPPPTAAAHRHQLEQSLQVAAPA